MILVQISNADVCGRHPTLGLLSFPLPLLKKKRSQPLNRGIVGGDCGHICVFVTSGDEWRPAGPGGTCELLHVPLKGNQIKGVR